VQADLQVVGATRYKVWMSDVLAQPLSSPDLPFVSTLCTVALALFTGDGDGGAALLAHVESEMRQASVEQRYERAAWLRRRLRRLRELTADLAGLQAIHARPRLVVAPHPRGGTADAFWLVGGRLVDWGPVQPVDGGDSLADRCAKALRSGDGRGSTSWLAPDEVDEMRVVTTYLASHDLPGIDLAPDLDAERLAAFADSATAAAVV